MNKNEINYILNEIKKANNLSKLAFNYLYKLGEKPYSKTIFRITEINEILTNLEIDLESKLEINEKILDRR